LQLNPNLWDPNLSKTVYHVDHYIVPLCSRPESIVEHTRYWYGLFSHRRDCTWKGMLRVDIGSQADDDVARQLMESKS
jgi:hypothetical protein